jgi:hypothetical protein
MNKSLLLASLVAAVALAACGKKEEAPAPAPPRKPLRPSRALPRLLPTPSRSKSSVLSNRCDARPPSGGLLHSRARRALVERDPAAAHLAVGDVQFG